MKIKRQLTVLALALSAALPMSVPTAALAQTAIHSHRAAPAVQSFGVTQVSTVSPGSELAFVLNGTPGATVTLQITGATGEVQMDEVQPGAYEGRYTVRSRDRLNNKSPVVAQMQKDGLSTRVSLRQSLVLGARDLVAAPLERITGFSVEAPERVRPGDEINFSLTGQPGGQARVTLIGVRRSIPLTEVRPGVYEGSYVLRRDDKMRGDLVADGFLINNRIESSQRYGRSQAEGGLAYGRDDRRGDRADRNDRNDRTDRSTVACVGCGRVESVTQVEVKGDSPNVIGTIAGGLLGGVIGNQVGGGSGKDVARVLGAVGGAYAGNRIENNMGKAVVYRVAVRLDGGATQSFDYAEDPALQVGARVRVDNGALVRL